MTEAIYSLAAPLPNFIVRARDNTLTGRLERDGAVAAVTAATITVFDDSGLALVDEAAATAITGGVATYSLLAAIVPVTLNLAGRYQVRWRFTVTGEAHTVERVRSAYLVRHEIGPPITESDLEADHQGLSGLLAPGVRLQAFIDSAWKKCMRRILNDGKVPAQIGSPSDLSDVLLHWAFELIYLDAATSAGDGQWLELADRHEAKRKQAYGELTFDYDFSEDGLIDGDEEDANAAASVFMGGPGQRTFRYGYGYGGHDY